MAQGAGNVQPVQRSTKTFKVLELRSKKTDRVLFLEAGKDFVDTLFSFLLLPAGSIIHILSQVTEEKTFGGISTIFESVKALDSSFLLVDKQALVQPTPAAAPGGTCGSSAGLQLQQHLEAENMLQKPHKKWPVLSGVYYGCFNCNGLSITRRARCETCYKRYKTGCFSYSQGPYYVQEREPYEVNISNGSLVKENIAFIITDSLQVMPSTTISSISVLNKMGVTSLADLENSEITVSITQVLQLIHSALTSDSCLNDVLGKK